MIFLIPARSNAGIRSKPMATVNAEIVVNAGGLWAREVGHMAGLQCPCQ